MKKRIVALLLICAMVAVLSGCKNTSKTVKVETSKKQSEIKLYINENKISLKNKKIYLSKDKVLMLPLEVIKDDLEIAVNEFSSEKIVVEKSDSKAVIKVGSDKVGIKDGQYALGEKVVRKDNTTYIPVTLLANYLRFSESFEEKTRTLTITDITRGNDLPSRYSYVDEGRLPKIRDQKNQGYCWAYAALSAVESSLMPANKCDFDTMDLINYAKERYDIKSGGNYSMTLAYLLSGKGPVDTNSKKVSWHLRSAQMFNEKNITRIKQLVFKYGGVESSMFLDKRVEYDKKHYNADNSAYYSDIKNPVNHDLVIVGWDDEYPRDNFATKPKKDGAFICQNSWGKAFGEDGIFYVSYEDATIGTDNICYTKLDDVDYNMYETDEYGMNSTMSLNDENKVYFANVYKSNKDEGLKSVGFYATHDNVDYTVYVIKDYDGEKSLCKLGKKVAKGNIKYKGFYSVDLDKEIKLDKGNDFAVVVKVSCVSDKDLVPLQSSTKDANIDVDEQHNRGYYSATGEFWKRAEDSKRNVCLKAFTLDK